MSVDPLTVPDYESLDQTDEALAAMMARLRAIIDGGELREDAFVEICAIYNNVAYIFLYLESNEAHINYERVLPWRAAFYRDSDLDAALLGRLRALRCADADADEARSAYMTHLQQKLNVPELLGGESHEQLLAEAKDVLVGVRHDAATLLERLGHPGGANPSATFYKLVSSTAKAATRTKLSRAWEHTRDRRLADLVSVVDRMVDARRRESQAHGAESVLAETLRRCRIPKETAANYTEEYLVAALRHHARLESEILAATDSRDHAIDHFGYYVRGLQANRMIPLFPLSGCLEFITFIARRLFGLRLTEMPGSSPHVVVMNVDLDGKPVGYINLDLWDTGRTRRAANTTKGIRNRTHWGGLEQRPVAYVSCRFRQAADGSNRITFQNVHSLFHEFGHAVNHLLIRKRLPTQSGLEYLPLERLEDLSMWFEKWVYHPQFAEHMKLTAAERDGLALCQDVKRLEYRRSHVDRAVTAALDFDLHGRADGGIEAAFLRLDDAYGIGASCTLGDFAQYFTWPMFQANPGANFAYLWGAGASAQAFAPFMTVAVEEAGTPAEVRALFSSCFDFDEPSVEPDGDAVFTFYDGPLRALTQEGGSQ